MFVSSKIIKHGIIALEGEIIRLNKLHEQYGDEWPLDFDPNDISLFEAILQDLCKNKTTGYEEKDCNSKPFRFFIGLLYSYTINHMAELSQEDRSELLCVCSEAHIGRVV